MSEDQGRRGQDGIRRLRDGVVWQDLSWRDRGDWLVLAFSVRRYVGRSLEDHSFEGHASGRHVEGHLRMS